MVSGMEDAWNNLCKDRSKNVALTVELRERVRLACRSPRFTSDSLQDHFPELGADEYTTEQLACAHRLQSLMNMDASIPTNMMRGIESVASRLAGDINRGKCDLGSLDLEKIGQEVISNVSENDIMSFAANIDKILPTLKDAL